jgi:hypothetical protein
MRWVGNVALIGEMNTYNILVGEPEGKRPLGDRCRKEDRIQMDRKEIRCDVDCIRLAQYWDEWQALVNMIMNRRVP